MKWKYVKPLDSINNISEFECLVKYSFPEDFKKCVIKNNGGRPFPCDFDTDKMKERTIKSFLSFNKGDKETIWKIYDCSKKELGNKYIPFAIDHFGNLICFNTENDNVIFFDHENLSVEKVKNNFKEFLDSLYIL